MQVWRKHKRMLPVLVQRGLPASLTCKALSHRLEELAKKRKVEHPNRCMLKNCPGNHCMPVMKQMYIARLFATKWWHVWQKHAPICHTRTPGVCPCACREAPIDGIPPAAPAPATIDPPAAPTVATTKDVVTQSHCQPAVSAAVPTAVVPATVPELPGKGGEPPRRRLRGPLPDSQFWPRMPLMGTHSLGDLAAPAMASGGFTKEPSRGLQSSPGINKAGSITPAGNAAAAGPVAVSTAGPPAPATTKAPLRASDVNPSAPEQPVSGDAAMELVDLPHGSAVAGAAANPKLADVCSASGSEGATPAAAAAAARSESGVPRHKLPQQLPPMPPSPLDTYAPRVLQHTDRLNRFLTPDISPFDDRLQVLSCNCLHVAMP